MHKMHKVGHSHKFIYSVIFAALLLAVFVSFWGHPEFVAFVGRFFDVMLPVLAVGALLKYLFSYSRAKGGSTAVKENFCELCGAEVLVDDEEGCCPRK
jgi:hypothetical protein